jgi:uncharacterized membrane protein YdjX (TVP38/TMEM64 family)
VNVAWRRAEAALVFLTSFLLAALVIKYKHHVQHLLSTVGPLAYPLSVAMFAVVASAPFSVTDALAIMNGVLFGPLWGSVVNAVGLVIAALAGYALARRTAHLLELGKSIERLPPWVRRWRVGSPAFLLTLRVIPGLGGTLATQIAAAFRTPVFVHVWTMCAIAIPICTVLAIFGDRASEAVHTYYEAHRPHVDVHVPRRFPNFFHHRRPTPPPEHP